MHKWSIQFVATPCFQRYSWKELNLPETYPRPFPRAQHSSIAIGNSIFVMYGRNEQGLQFDDLWRLDIVPANDLDLEATNWEISWTKLKSNSKETSRSMLSPWIAWNRRFGATITIAPWMIIIWGGIFPPQHLSSDSTNPLKEPAYGYHDDMNEMERQVAPLIIDPCSQIAHVLKVNQSVEQCPLLRNMHAAAIITGREKIWQESWYGWNNPNKRKLKLNRAQKRWENEKGDFSLIISGKKKVYYSSVYEKKQEK